MPELTISPEKVCFIVMRARGIEAKEAGPGLGEGSTPSDQGLEDEVADLDVLDSNLDDAGLNDRIASRLELIALICASAATMRPPPDDWDEILEQVAASQDTPPEDYLLGIPLLAEYLEAGLERFGISCVGLEPSGMWPEAVVPAKTTR